MMPLRSSLYKSARRLGLLCPSGPISMEILHMDSSGCPDSASIGYKCGWLKFKGSKRLIPLDGNWIVKADLLLDSLGLWKKGSEVDEFSIEFCILVIDRETGKPKGYGFCEYKDEETALSARRNLQGYEINGRQLRVDFAENDKNTDKSREQGRGGPGMVANVGPQKQFGGLAIGGDSAFQQPIGLQVAMAAATVMAGVLGGAQAGRELNPNGLQGQAASYSDPLTLHLAKMSRNQLNEVMSELKVMATQSKEQAHQLLLASPMLPKALFQAQIMLGMVTSQMLQMPNIRQASGPLAQPLSQGGPHGQQPVVPTQNKMQFGLIPREQESQVSCLHPNSLAHNQYSSVSQLPTQPRVQLPQPVQSQVVDQSTLPNYSGISILPSVRPPPVGSVSFRPQIPEVTSFYEKQQTKPPLLQHGGEGRVTNSGHTSHSIAPNATFQTSLLTHPLLPNQNFQPGTSASSGIPEKANIINTSDRMSRPSKLMKLDVGRSTLAVGANVTPSLSGPSRDSGANLYENQIPKAEAAPNSQKKVNQIYRQLVRPYLDELTVDKEPDFLVWSTTLYMNLSLSSAPLAMVWFYDTCALQLTDPSAKFGFEVGLQLPPEVESTLLQQVLNLTPEQLSSLPPDQQQQVIQLQQMLR
ncbi:hypothetical protein RHGRI_031893 [Rhododendron griersonianum]|uniref:RRM domain-containing protein n=1 Tax=Rhododendron griersonianum TaxID=479676 RepID=A0AAV6I9I5_9ERIC|nr:hypothetical protein RHGRI_031893 [Rhododendron griersonianum]